jgi:hypothetical protein
MPCGHVIEQIKASGTSSLRAIAKTLNARGIATARGGIWTPVQVTAVLAPGVVSKWQMFNLRS